jgi:hypothetical protein
MFFFTLRIRSGVRLLWPKGSPRLCRVPLSLEVSLRRSSSSILFLEYRPFWRVAFERPITVRVFFFDLGFKRIIRS